MFNIVNIKYQNKKGTQSLDKEINGSTPMYMSGNRCLNTVGREKLVKLFGNQLLFQL
jgi:hypothetical protein